MKNSISVMPPAEKEYTTSFCGYCSAVRCMQLLYGVFACSGICQSRPVLAVFVGGFFPPQFPTDIRMYNIMDSVAVTIAMAISSTTIAGILAFFTALFASELVSPFPKCAKFVRGFATFLRNIPALVWAFILFSSLGIGTGVGFAALLITSFAFMVRAFTETMEDISVDCLESLEAVGAGFWQRVAHGIVPSCISGFLAWFLYCIEVNVRASTIVGMVGGGGVGMVLFSYIKSFNYHMAFTVILIIAAVVILVDRITGKIRKELEQ